MKKLYRKSTVHPTPPPIRSDHLSLLLPAALLSLAAALPADDRHVLAYLVSCSASADDHHRPSDRGPIYGCGCFSCYTSFWVRWDKSENRRLIHDIIDALEDSSPPPPTQKKPQSKKERKKRGSKKNQPAPERSRADSKPDPPPEESGFAGESERGGGGVEEEERGSVRKIVSFIGEKIWGVWA